MNTTPAEWSPEEQAANRVASSKVRAAAMLARQYGLEYTLKISDGTVVSLVIRDKSGGWMHILHSIGTGRPRHTATRFYYPSDKGTSVPVGGIIARVRTMGE